jgi:hypothetical protein
MDKQRKVFRIPKDPRSDYSAFVTEIPLELVDVISQEEWRACISEINEVFAKAESPSVWNLLKLVLIIPAFYKIRTYEAEIDKAIQNLNFKLRDKGIRFEDPTSNSYTELVVIYTPKVN